MASYDISGTGYWKRYSELTDRYRAARIRAERIRHENGNKPSREEALEWDEAAKRCEEILGLVKGERDSRIQWESRLQESKTNHKQIVDVLDPPKPAPEKQPRPVEPVKTSASSDKADAAGHVTTASGFRTRNAVKGTLSAETIESWYQKPNPELSMEHVIGMKNFKERLEREAADIDMPKIRESLGLKPMQTYFFYGPSGGGKTYLIESFANDMMKKGFKFLKIRGSEIHSSYVGEAEKIVNAIFHEAIDAAPCILFIDEIEGVCANRSGPEVRAHEKTTTIAFLEARNDLYSSNARVIFFGGTNLPWNVDPAMVAAAKLIRVPLPDEEARRGFFRQRFEMLALEQGFSYDEMAEVTDNYDFHELSKQLVPAILNSVKQELVEANWVYDEKGERDFLQTDEKVAELVKSGKAMLRREIFDRERKALNLPRDKTEVRRRLLEFEKGAGA